MNTQEIGSAVSGVSGSEPNPNSSANLSGNYTSIPSLGWFGLSGFIARI